MYVESNKISHYHKMAILAVWEKKVILSRNCEIQMYELSIISKSELYRKLRWFPNLNLNTMNFHINDLTPSKFFF